MIDVFPLALGGNTFGWTSDEPTSQTVLDAYVGGGGNFIDTADGYSAWAPGNSGGESETIIGNWTASRGNRADIVIGTKVSQHPAFRGLAASNVHAAVDASLHRLQTDYIDVYYAHFDDASVPLEETVEAFDELRTAGKIREVGVSNYSPERLQEWINIATRRGFALPVALQPHYNLVKRSGYETGLAPVVAAHGLGVVPYFALASGFLTGKYRSEADLRGASREQMANAYMSAEGLAVVEVLDRVARARAVAIRQSPSPGSEAGPVSQRRSRAPEPSISCRRCSRPRRSSSLSRSGRSSTRCPRTSTADGVPRSAPGAQLRRTIALPVQPNRSESTETKGTALTTKTVLIIGGTSGMGRAVADLAAARGDVAIVAGRSQKRVDRVAGEIGGTARGVVIDLTDEHSIKDAVESVGAVDHLVLAAAALTYAPFAELSIDDAKAVFENKFWGYYRAVSIIAPKLPQDGSITIFSGVAADRPAPGTVAVTAVNAALEGLTRSLAVELAPIRVNSISPGTVDTEAYDHMTADEKAKSFEEQGKALLVGRVGRPEDIASTVVHLIDNGYTTASNVHVDGGARLV